MVALNLISYKTKKNTPKKKINQAPVNRVTVQLNKKLGQHLLKNPGILDKILNAAKITKADSVLEIGPGTGNLTVRLLKEARQVHAIDIDERMVGEVKKRALQNGLRNLHVSCGDALTLQFPQFDVCVANLPYQISSPFTFKLLAHKPRFRCAVLMFQKEFAERNTVASLNNLKGCFRLCAKPGDSFYCRLSVNVQLFARVVRVCTVKAENFTPPPKVDSAIVKIIPNRNEPKLDMKEWNLFLLYCFGRKRRTLYSCLTIKPLLTLLSKNYSNYCQKAEKIPEITDFREVVKEILQKLDLEGQRVVNLDSSKLIALLEEFHSRNLYFCSNDAELPDDVDMKYEASDDEMISLDP